MSYVFNPFTGNFDIAAPGSATTPGGTGRRGGPYPVKTDNAMVSFTVGLLGVAGILVYKFLEQLL